jgi:hypothetical protein
MSAAYRCNLSIQRASLMSIEHLLTTSQQLYTLSSLKLPEMIVIARLALRTAEIVHAHKRLSIKKNSLLIYLCAACY